MTGEGRTPSPDRLCPHGWDRAAEGECCLICDEADEGRTPSLCGDCAEGFHGDCQGYPDGSCGCDCPDASRGRRVAASGRTTSSEPVVVRQVNGGLIDVWCRVCEVGGAWPDKGLGRATAAAWVTRHQHREQR